MPSSKKNIRLDARLSGKGIRLEAGLLILFTLLYLIASNFFLTGYRSPNGFSLSFISLLWANIIIALAVFVFHPAWGFGAFVLACLGAINAEHVEGAWIFVLAFSYILVLWTSLAARRRIKRDSRDEQLRQEKLEEEYNLLLDEHNKRASLTPALEKKLRKFTVITEAVEAISNSLELDKTLHLAADITFYILEKGDHCLLFMYNYKQNSLELRAAAASPKNKEAVKQKTGSRFDAWVMKNKQALIIQDADKDFRFGDVFEDGQDMNIKSLIAVPMMHKSNLLGIIHLDASRRGAFLPDDLRVLDIMANLTALVIQNTLLYDKTKELAIRDSLTNLFVHRHFHKRLEEECKRAEITSTPISLIIFDVDNFKNYNDTHGHPAGDRVLVRIAKIIVLGCPKDSIIGRYGGDEFCIILPRTQPEDALVLAEELRMAVEDAEFVLRRVKTKCTISMGVSSYPLHAQNEVDLIKTADQALYRAKEQGRNAACLTSS